MLKLHTKLHALTPALASNLRPGSANSASPLLTAALSSLRGLTRRSSRSSDLVGHRAFFCSDSDSSGDVVVHVEAKAVDCEAEEVDTKSSSAIVSTNPRPEDYLTVLALPLPHRPLFPGFYMPIYVKDPKLLATLQESRKRQAPYAGAFLVKDEPGADPSLVSGSGSEKNIYDLKGKDLLNRLHEVGTLAQISSIQGDQVVLIGHRRLQITEMVSEDPLTVKVDHLKASCLYRKCFPNSMINIFVGLKVPYTLYIQFLSFISMGYILYWRTNHITRILIKKPYNKDDDVIKATSFEVISTLIDVLKTSSLWRDHVQTYTQHIGDFNFPRLADFGAAISGANKLQCQQVLEELDVCKRLKLTLELVKKEMEISKIQDILRSGILSWLQESIYSHSLNSFGCFCCGLCLIGWLLHPVTLFPHLSNFYIFVLLFDILLFLRGARFFNEVFLITDQNCLKMWIV